MSRRRAFPLILVVLWAVAGGCGEPGLNELPRPHTGRMEPQVRRQLEERRQALEALAVDGARPGELAEAMGVERIVYIDIHEYRLNPIGNSWLWDGACIAEVGIIEADGIDPDMFADAYTVRAKYPDLQGVGRESATPREIETGLLRRFIQHTAWLFFLHTEPKYPDKYQPHVDNDSDYFRRVGSQ